MLSASSLLLASASLRGISSAATPLFFLAASSPPATAAAAADTRRIGRAGRRGCRHGRSVRRCCRGGAARQCERMRSAGGEAAGAARAARWTWTLIPSFLQRGGLPFKRCEIELGLGGKGFRNQPYCHPGTSAPPTFAPSAPSILLVASQGSRGPWRT